VPEVMAYVCAQDKAKENSSMAAKVTFSEEQMLIVYFIMQYNTGFYTQSQVTK
jgi:hypothetical protein